MPYRVVGSPNTNRSNTPEAGLAPFDRQMLAYLDATQIPNASLSVRRDGMHRLSHTYTLDTSAYVPTPQRTMYRLGMLTQPLVAAAVRNLAGRASPPLTLSTKVASHLTGLPYEALPSSYAFPDPQWDAITVEQLLDHTAGFDPSFDTFFDARGVSGRAGLDEPPNKAQNVADVAAKTLKYAPGSAPSPWSQRLSIMAYTVLGVAVEAIMLQPVLEVVRAQLAQGHPGNLTSGLGVYTPCLQPAHTGWATPNEAPPDSDGATGPTVFDPRPGTVSQVPTALGGGGFFLEGHDSGVGLLGTTEALAAFIDLYAHDGNWLPVPRTSYSFTWSSSFAGHFVSAFWWGDGRTSIAVAFNRSVAEQATKVTALVTAAMGAVAWS